MTWDYDYSETENVGDVRRMINSRSAGWELVNGTTCAYLVDENAGAGCGPRNVIRIRYTFFWRRPAKESS
jgi:hypothetical protein